MTFLFISIGIFLQYIWELYCKKQTHIYRKKYFWEQMKWLQHAKYLTQLSFSYSLGKKKGNKCIPFSAMLRQSAQLYVASFSTIPYPKREQSFSPPVTCSILTMSLLLFLFRCQIFESSAIAVLLFSTELAAISFSLLDMWIIFRLLSSVGSLAS